jgi:hypothetical protein
MECGFTDCLTYLLGGALVGAVVGVGGTYLLSGKRGEARIAAMRKGLRLKEASPATAGLGGRHRSRRPSLGGCGCGG